MYIIISEERNFPVSLKFKYPELEFQRSVTFFNAVFRGLTVDEGILVDIKYLKQSLFEILQSLQNDYPELIIKYYSINKCTPPYFITKDINIEQFSDKVIDSIIQNPSEKSVTLTFNDQTDVIIDQDTYNKYKPYIQYMDYYEIVKECAYEVKDGNMYNF